MSNIISEIILGVGLFFIASIHPLTAILALKYLEKTLERKREVGGSNE